MGQMGGDETEHGRDGMGQDIREVWDGMDGRDRTWKNAVAKAYLS